MSQPLPNYSPIIVGTWVLTMPIVCNDGVIRPVRIEQFQEGFCSFLKMDDGSELTNRTPYATTHKAINAAAGYVGSFVPVSE